MTRRVLVLGGTGAFGTRLVRHLATHREGIEDTSIVVGARNAARGETFARGLADETGTSVEFTRMDVGSGLDDVLATLRPWAVIDCTGPFQGAGTRTAEAVLATGAHAIDLADARDYLAAYPSLGALARERGVAGIAGASSTPALSGAVARDLTAGWSEIDATDIAIVPGGRSIVGHAVLEAVLGYTGRPVPVWRGGSLAHETGWRGGRPLDVPGLGRRRVATVETADAERLGPRLGAREVTFRAGLESVLEQRGIEGLALVRSVLPNGGFDPRPLAAPLQRVRAVTRLTTGDLGGMVVEARGSRDGDPVRARWTLLARNDHGPHVPTLAAIAALRALARGRVSPGAYVADEVLGLNAIMAEATTYEIEAMTERWPDVVVESEAARDPAEAA